MYAACVREIVELHDFFQGWLDGSLPATEAAFARFSGVTDPAFTLIAPDGRSADHDETTAWIRAAHGARPGFRLWTDAHRLHYAEGGTAVLTYREWQTSDGATTVRLSSAVFRTQPGTPNGVAWVHVHETWIAA